MNGLEACLRKHLKVPQKYELKGDIYCQEGRSEVTWDGDSSFYSNIVIWNAVIRCVEETNGPGLQALGALGISCINHFWPNTAHTKQLISQHCQALAFDDVVCLLLIFWESANLIIILPCRDLRDSRCVGRQRVPAFRTQQLRIWIQPPLLFLTP